MKGASEPAFPGARTEQMYGRLETREVSYSGMTLRDYFAAKAMQPIISKLHFQGLLREDDEGDYLKMADVAYQVADAMLKQRNQE